MKILRYLVLSLALVFLLPIGVFAEGEEITSTEDNKVKVYVFRGEGCSHCAEALEWFSTIEEEYGSKYELIDYETWYSEENSELMKKVAEIRGEEEKATGVPYIIIGDKSWVGWSTDNNGPEVKAQIDSEYEKAVDERYDVMKLTETGDEKKSYGADIAALIIIFIVVGGICYGVYKARNNID